MTTNDQAFFEELEIEHNNTTFYANGYVDYVTTEEIGGNYEGYAFEIVYKKEISEITISDLWYDDEETGTSVNMLYEKKYREIVKIAEEVVRYEFE